jgi:hypothetical protein
MIELKKVLESQKTKSEVLKFLDSHRVKYSSLQNGEEFIISMSSFNMVFNEKGELVSSETL